MKTHHLLTIALCALLATSCTEKATQEEPAPAKTDYRDKWVGTYEGLSGSGTVTIEAYPMSGGSLAVRCVEHAVDYKGDSVTRKYLYGITVDRNGQYPYTSSRPKWRFFADSVRAFLPAVPVPNHSDGSYRRLCCFKVSNTVSDSMRYYTYETW